VSKEKRSSIASGLDPQTKLKEEEAVHSLQQSVNFQKEVMNFYTNQTLEELKKMASNNHPHFKKLADETGKKWTSTLNQLSVEFYNFEQNLEKQNPVFPKDNYE